MALVPGLRPMRVRSISGAVLIAVIASLAAGLSIAISSEDHAGRHLSLGGHELTIPRQYLLEGGLDRWIRLIPGLDDSSREILVRFPAHEIAAHTPGYEPNDGELKEDMPARIVALTPIDLQNHLDPERFRDLWYRTGGYADAVVEEDRGRELLKVFRRVEYPRSWALVSMLSEAGSALPNSVLDFWVAHCLDGPSSETPSGHHVTCMAYAIRGDLMVEFNISEQNLAVIDSVRQFILDTVKRWETGGGD